MKKITSVAVLLLTVGILLGTAMPASAVSFTTISVADATRGVSADASTGKVYVGTSPVPPPGTSPFDEWVSSAGVSVVDASSQKVVKSATIFTSRSQVWGFGVADVKVSQSSNDLWVLVSAGALTYECGGELYQLNKRTLVTVRSYDVGCAKRIELDPTSRSVYLLEGPPVVYFGQDDPRLKTPMKIVAVDGATGELRRAEVTPVASAGSGSIAPVALAFNARDRQLYLAGGSLVWVYTEDLALARTITIGAQSGPISIAANPGSNRIFVTDGTTLTEISVPARKVTRTAPLTDSSKTLNPQAVIDTDTNVLYLGTSAINLKNLHLLGQQPNVVQAVNPASHDRYLVVPGLLIINR